MPVPDLHSPDELKALVEEALERLDLWPELHGQATSVRYALEVGGKRVRPVIALAVGEALGAPVGQVMPAAPAIEPGHTFSLVHDDLPAMDDDEERRGHPSTWKKFGEGVGGLAGDALRAEALRPPPRRARRRGWRRAGGRRVAGGGRPARGSVRVVGGSARARRGDARDDRRPVPRHDG